MEAVYRVAEYCSDTSEGELRQILSSDRRFAYARLRTLDDAATSDAHLVVVPSDAFVSPALERAAPRLIGVVDASSGEPDPDRRVHPHVCDLLVRPLRRDEVLTRVAFWARRAEQTRAVDALRSRLGLRGLVGDSPAFRGLVDRIRRVAPSKANVTITGETGTGKELCARALHYLSARSSGPFVPLNCGAIPVQIAENELFGHVRGAFTHAEAPQRGLVAEASGGTLLLDEVDALPASVQVKLLRFLQEGEYRRLGSPELCRSDVRVIAACNRDLEDAVAKGRLREDLYYRLNTVHLAVPPLRERIDDVLPLAASFIRKYERTVDIGPFQLSDAAAAKLLGYDWPGNVRQLEHVVERAIVLSGSPTITADLVELPGGSEPASTSFKEAKATAVRRFERSYLERVLQKSNGNITQAARLAKKNRRALFELIRRHAIDVERFRR